MHANTPKNKLYLIILFATSLAVFTFLFAIFSATSLVAENPRPDIAKFIANPYTDIIIWYSPNTSLPTRLDMYTPIIVPASFIAMESTVRAPRFFNVN